MTMRFTNRLLDHLMHDGYRPTTIRNIVKDLRISHDDRAAFDETISSAEENGLIELGRDDCVRLPALPEEIVGSYRSNKRGFGFVKPNQRFREGDVYIGSGAEGDAVSGDTVRVVISQSGRWSGKGAAGKIVEVLERGRGEYVGTLFKRGNTWLAQPDGRELHDPIIIRDITAKDAKDGDKIVFEMLHYPEKDYYGEGVISRVLGDAGKPDVETQAVMLAYGLFEEFNEDSKDEARNAATHFEETGDVDREDLTSQFIFTIDPPDARDFDDAINITYDQDKKEWELGVHIADVASFVSVGSALDKGAIERGNSVYLPRKVIPMLPEVLSNGVCSLQEGVRRWAKSVFIRFDDKGRVLGHRLQNTVICSAKRLTYLEAQALIDGNEKEARKNTVAGGTYSEELIATLKRADSLAKKLLSRRRRDGMIELQLPEVVLEFDEDGHVIDAHPEDDAFTHRIIEMFMVEANEAVARTFAGMDIPILRRVHPEPKFGDMIELRLFARSVGVGISDEPTRHDLQRLLQATKDSDSSRAVHFAVLRTLSQAIYSPTEVGHFALASHHYAHFTSPIRRYPDLTLHRAIAAYLDHTDNGTISKGGKSKRSIIGNIRDDERVLDEGVLLDVGANCSSTERNAEQAERSLRTFLVMQFLNDKHLGDEFSGIITGFSSSGLFISLERFLIEGLCRFDSLKQSSKSSGRWEKLEGTGQIVAVRSGAVLSIGDKVTVQISAIDLPTRQMELHVIKMPKKHIDDIADIAQPARNSKRGGRNKSTSKNNKSKRRGKGRKCK
ncbi:MAG: VacB/RNase II family 3'-5' exoribonuclease [Phycisphaerae bacterium]|nr:VacB/RNase II family 3'-5' exoribonuclease [Phycisphaerae bacterium]MBT6269972.1 VacB/RNase II family 3'-5' exoribonuclease [Phycisphaerae bacterium]MBT6281770.1 VacB/RNase II family 3'-5' exoribonuclease [Phycisphaerae bacterium]